MTLCITPIQNKQFQIKKDPTSLSHGQSMDFRCAEHVDRPMDNQKDGYPHPDHTSPPIDHRLAQEVDRELRHSKPVTTIF